MRQAVRMSYRSHHPEQCYTRLRERTRTVLSCSICCPVPSSRRSPKQAVQIRRPARACTCWQPCVYPWVTPHPIPPRPPEASSSTGCRSICQPASQSFLPRSFSRIRPRWAFLPSPVNVLCCLQVTTNMCLRNRPNLCDFRTLAHTISACVNYQHMNTINMYLLPVSTCVLPQYRHVYRASIARPWHTSRTCPR